MGALGLRVTSTGTLNTGRGQSVYGQSWTVFYVGSRKSCGWGRMGSGTIDRKRQPSVGSVQLAATIIQALPSQTHVTLCGFALWVPPRTTTSPRLGS
jgi:hypothetical protein